MVNIIPCALPTELSYSERAGERVDENAMGALELMSVHGRELCFENWCVRREPLVIPERPIILHVTRALSTWSVWSVQFEVCAEECGAGEKTKLLMSSTQYHAGPRLLCDHELSLSRLFKTLHGTRFTELKYC